MQVLIVMVCLWGVRLWHAGLVSPRVQIDGCLIAKRVR
jgi:hypothetical protein